MPFFFAVAAAPHLYIEVFCVATIHRSFRPACLAPRDKFGSPQSKCWPRAAISKDTQKQPLTSVEFNYLV